MVAEKANDKLGGKTQGYKQDKKKQQKALFGVDVLYMD